MAKQSKSRPTDPVAKAKAALAAVLDRAVASKDDERILASAKQVLTMLDKAPTSHAENVTDKWMDWCAASELNALNAAFDIIDTIERSAKARRDQGGDPPPCFVVHRKGIASWRDTPESLEERKARYREEYPSSIASTAS